MGADWEERLWDSLKPAFDHASREGMNRLVWHAFVSSPASMGIPGQQYFAGTHLNPNVTWWGKSAPFFTYLNRVQFMLQQGRFVADAWYYYGDHVPNFAQMRSSDPARLGYGYDYDVITEEAILTRLSAKNGRVALPDGLTYRVLVLPDESAISLPVLRKVKELVEAGITVVGPAPKESATLDHQLEDDAEVQTIATALWSGKTGHGRVLSGRTAWEVLFADGVKPDFEFSAEHKDTALDYIHRQTDTAEIYFVASGAKAAERVTATFRTSGRTPEIWDSVTGDRRFASAYSEKDGRTQVPLEFSPCGSFFIVFRELVSAHPATGTTNTLSYTNRQTLSGPWEVRFDPRWGGPASAQFDELVSWPTRTEPGIRF